MKINFFLIFEAEMGADFNILEYADPELGTITGGEKTNILDLDLEQVEVDPKDEKQKKETKDDDQKPEITAPAAEMSTADSCATSTSLTLTENSNVPTITSTQATSQAIQAQVMQQQMHQQVQQAAAMGRPMPPGTKLLSLDGAVGVVTSTNTVTVSYPSNFPGHQRISQIQGERLKTCIAYSKLKQLLILFIQKIVYFIKLLIFVVIAYELL